VGGCAARERRHVAWERNGMDAAIAEDVIWLALTFILAVVLTVTLLIWGRTAGAPVRRD
jgi:hypothetical protein